MEPNNIDCSSICSHIPHVLQSLYTEEILNSTSLVEIRDAFRINQLQGKAWLLNQLATVDRDSKILVAASWLGFTSYCLHKMGFKYITETDVDSRLTKISNYINKDNPHFYHKDKDVNDLNISNYDIVINSSCEHIAENRWFEKIKVGALVILQSTNLKLDDHINTVDSIEEFKEKYNLNYLYADKLVFNDAFTRYMIVGEKI
jgi:hypothetical protein